MAAFLLDRAGDGMTAILFCDGAPSAEQAAHARPTSHNSTSALSRADPASGSTANAIDDAGGEIARLFGAVPGTLYLLRPDLHIAGRWKTIAPDEILRTARICLGTPTP